MRDIQDVSQGLWWEMMCMRILTACMLFYYPMLPFSLGKVCKVSLNCLQNRMGYNLYCHSHIFSFSPDVWRIELFSFWFQLYSRDWSTWPIYVHIMQVYISIYILCTRETCFYTINYDKFRIGYVRWAVVVFGV